MSRRTYRRTLRIAVCIVLGVVGCGSADSSDTSMRLDDVCVYATAKCFPDLCDGCTVAGYGKCPPKDSDYVEICSEVAEDGCKAMAVPPAIVSPSSTQLRYTKDVRLLRGVASCNQYRQQGERGATSITRYCSGACM